MLEVTNTLYIQFLQMKNFFHSKPFIYISIGLNLVFVITVIIVLFVLNSMGLLSPFSSTNKSLSEIPVFDESEIVIEPIAKNLEIPWDLEFIEDDKILVTERKGRVRLIENGKLQSEPVLDLSSVIISIGEAGLMGIAKHPNFSENQFIYLYHTYNDAGKTKLKIVRYIFENNKLVNEEIIFRDIPAGSIHSGGQMEFGPDGKLYVTTGDIGVAELAQDLDSFAGKTLRMNDDGTVPNDNPFFTSEDASNARNYIFSYGHRNAQGLDWHPLTLEMYQSEHGPSGFDGGTGMDEINIVKRGGDYGWPTIRGEETQEGMYSPLLTYSPAVAPASASFYDGSMFPALKNRLLVGTLRGNTLLVIKTDGDIVKEEFRLFESEYGRIRYVSVAPDGSIYFTTSNRDGRGNPVVIDDVVYRISRK